MKILFVHNALRSFVRLDLEILRSEHEVREIKFAPNAHGVRDVAQSVSWCDLVFGWWASWHMLLPAFLAGKRGKAVIVVGGDYDVIYDPFGRTPYRLLLDRLRQGLGRLMFRWIDWFVTFSQFSRAEALRLPYVDPNRTLCIRLGLPDLAAGRRLAKTDTVLTVGTVSRYEILRKGLGTFVKASALLPHYEFKLTGIWQDDAIRTLRHWNDRNITYTGCVPDSELFREMSEAKVYVQASHHEGFGMALAEAMLFQCAPVVTDRGSLPEVVGDTGLYVAYDDPIGTAAAIEEACRRQSELGPRARARVLSLFPLERRKQQLLSLVDSMRAQHPGPRA